MSTTQDHPCGDLATEHCNEPEFQVIGVHELSIGPIFRCKYICECHVQLSRRTPYSKVIRQKCLWFFGIEDESPLSPEPHSWTHTIFQHLYRVSEFTKLLLYSSSSARSSEARPKNMGRNRCICNSNTTYTYTRPPQRDQWSWLIARTGTSGSESRTHRLLGTGKTINTHIETSTLVPRVRPQIVSTLLLLTQNSIIPNHPKRFDCHA